MLQSPSEVAASNSANVRRFNNLLQKHFPEQAKKYKNIQRIRLRPGCGPLWFHELMSDKQELKHIVACVNDSLEGCGWKITKAEPACNSPRAGHPTSIVVTLKYTS